jgi:cation diffusion facilitator CzcD-associated flavoprotein CzcO
MALFSFAPCASVLDVLIVGAGPAGLGCAIALRECGVENLLVVDRDGVGASFEKWPVQMRMITPSFHSNPYGQVDLNAITPHTSPADYLRTEHPTGQEYARYLRSLAQHYEIPLRGGVEVKGIGKKKDIFHLTTSADPIRARFVIWAAGEFFHPDNGGIEGAEWCLHNSTIADWRDLPGVEHAVIGGFESGIDAAIHLARAGKSVHVLSRGEPWHHDSPDPSRTLTPYTRDRLKSVYLEAAGSIRLYKNADIVRVERYDECFAVIDRDGIPFEISTPPILCTGFGGALRGVEEHFNDESGKPVFSEEADESLVTSGLFYSGPALQHRGTLFCFIYKFRGRFGIIARAIAERLDLEWSGPLKLWWQRGFLIEDLACCTDCTCAVEAEEEVAPAPVAEYIGTSEIPDESRFSPSR